MSSSPPPSPPRTSSPPPFGPMSDEEREAYELSRMMKSPSPPPNGAPSTTSSGTGSVVSQQDDWSTSSLRIESDRGRRLAVAKKLHPYQRDLIDEFIKGTPLGREVSLFINQQDIINKLDAIVMKAQIFTVSDALMENIKAYVFAVLLSSKLASYKGSIPRDHVMNIIRIEGLNLPENYERDSNVLKTIGCAVSEELTQCRARIKKEIKSSIKDNVSVYELANDLTHGTRYVVTAPLCARLALLRAMHEKDSSPNGFWTGIDKRLQLIRTTVANDSVKITRAFVSYLDKDRSRFGGHPNDIPNSAATSDAAVWQESVDGVVDSQKN